MEFFIQKLRAEVNKLFLKSTRKVILLYTCLLYSNLREQGTGDRRNYSPILPISLTLYQSDQSSKGADLETKSHSLKSFSQFTALF
jgi:hypothetical protein